MISPDEARWIAAHYFIETYGRTFLDDCAMFHHPLATGEHSWVFGFTSKAYLWTLDDTEVLMGNAPVLIDMRGGRVVTLGTYKQIEKFVADYEMFGDPHVPDAQYFELVGKTDEFDLIGAARALERWLDVRLETCLSMVQDCLDGLRPFVNCPEGVDRQQLVLDLWGNGLKLGFHSAPEFDASVERDWPAQRGRP